MKKNCAALILIGLVIAAVPAILILGGMIISDQTKADVITQEYLHREVNPDSDSYGTLLYIEDNNLNNVDINAVYIIQLSNEADPRKAVLRINYNNFCEFRIEYQHPNPDARSPAYKKCLTFKGITVRPTGFIIRNSP